MIHGQIGKQQDKRFRGFMLYPGLSESWIQQEHTARAYSKSIQQEQEQQQQQEQEQQQQQEQEQEQQ